MTEWATPAPAAHPGPRASLDALAVIPEEVWLASQESARTRRAYRQDVAHFTRTLGVTTPEQLRQVNHRAVIAWDPAWRSARNRISHAWRSASTLSACAA